MRRLLLPVAALLSLASVSALAQTAAPPGPVTAPRNPSPATAGVTTPGTQPAGRTVQDIDRKLLSQEKDRPRLPNQAPSPSQGGTSTGAVSTATHPPQP